MKQNILHVGLDVDDSQFHGSAFNKTTGEVIDFKGKRGRIHFEKEKLYPAPFLVTNSKFEQNSRHPQRQPFQPFGHFAYTDQKIFLQVWLQRTWVS
jgi:hypothetical protein